jgi:hypothetical protein
MKKILFVFTLSFILAAAGYVFSAGYYGTTNSSTTGLTLGTNATLTVADSVAANITAPFGSGAFADTYDGTGVNITATTANITTLTAATANITGGNVTGLSTLTSNVTIITDSATANVTAAQMMGQMHLATANITLSLPLSSVGYSGTYQVSGGNYTVSIDVANATDIIVLNGTPLSAGYKATNSSTIYDEIYCVCRTAGRYICTAIQGLWVDGGN